MRVVGINCSLPCCSGAAMEERMFIFLFFKFYFKEHNDICIYFVIIKHSKEMRCLSLLTSFQTESSRRSEPRRDEGWDVVWNRFSSKPWASCSVALGTTGAAWRHTLTICNLNTGEKYVLGMKKDGKFCWCLGSFWFNSVGIIEQSSGVLVPPLITV